VEGPGGTGVVLPSFGTFRPVTSRPVQVVTTADGAFVTDGVVECELSATPADRWRPVGALHAEHGGLPLSLVVDGTAEQNLPGHVVALDALPALEKSRWSERIGAAWRLLVADHRQVAEEIGATLSVLTPLATSRPGYAALTFANALGCVAMSLPEDPRTLAVALAHEVQHAKLSALLDLFPLVDSLSPSRMRVPWRQDLRPPVAVLHGVYAHLAVSAFWRRYDDREARLQFAHWSRATRAAACSLLDSGTLTELGEAFVNKLLRVVDGWPDFGDQCQCMDKKLSM
jgi:HEXXH motif-containing protein